MESPQALPSFTANRALFGNTNKSTPRLVRGVFVYGMTDYAAVRLIHPTLTWSWVVEGQGMPNYRRAYVPGASWFFTVNLLRRGNNDLLVRHIDLLRNAVRRVHRLHPFVIDAWVVLPDHMRCVWTLPPGDTAYSLRWRLIKTFFCRALPPDEYRSRLRLLRGERGIWQRRYWEHLIRDDDDFRRHVDYVHINPLKHGLVASLQDWPYSSFHRGVRLGLYPLGWAGGATFTVVGGG